jgi:hypothetical protein
MHFKNLKKDIKEKMGDAIEDKLDNVKQVFGDVKEVSVDQGRGVKAEAEDLKRLYQHAGFIYFQTDAIAIVIRKLGALDEFLKTVDKLTKEGYRMMHVEDVKTIASSFGISLPTLPFGSLYYFQHKKYIT